MAELISIKGLAKFAHPYFAVNLAIAATYPLLKWIPSLERALYGEDVPLEAINRESEILLFMAAAVVIKIRRSKTTEQYIGTLLFYAKIANLMLIYPQSKRFAFVYVLCCIGG
eukprot:Opistho-2@57222